MAATIVSRFVRGTNSRVAGREAKLAAREALRAPRLADLARLDDAAFRALFAKSRGQAHRPRAFRPQCADRDRQFRRRRSRRAKPSGCSTMPRRWCAAPRSGRSAGSTATGSSAMRETRRNNETDPERDAPNGRRARRALTRLNAHAHLLRLRLLRANISSAEFGRKFDRIIGTVRGAERAADPECLSTAATCARWCSTARRRRAELSSAIAAADYALVSIPPDDERRSGAAACSACAGAREAICARSSISRRSASMAIAAAAGSTRKRRRPEFGAQPRGLPPSKPGGIRRAPWQSRRRPCVLPAFTGPDRMRSLQIARGKARRIVKPGQVFNRIHVGDIAQAIDAAFTRRVAAFSTSRTMSHRRPAIRSSLPRS